MDFPSEGDESGKERPGKVVGPTRVVMIGEACGYGGKKQKEEWTFRSRPNRVRGCGRILKKASVCLGKRHLRPLPRAQLCPTPTPQPGSGARAPRQWLPLALFGCPG